MTNAQVALEAASRVHQKTANDQGGKTIAPSSKGYNLSTSSDVLVTADAFLAWLNKNTQSHERL